METFPFLCLAVNFEFLQLDWKPGNKSRKMLIGFYLGQIKHVTKVNENLRYAINNKIY